MTLNEWSKKKKFNPFNSDKLFAHIHRWKEIKRDTKQMPAPTLVTIDPINLCDLKCVWCNSDYILSHNKKKISQENLDAIVELLLNWNTHRTYNNVSSVCIAGGGEPLLHSYTGTLINKLAEKGISSGVVTNGTHIDNHLESLANCTWVGVSIDSASPETFLSLKGRDKYLQVIDNVKRLIEHSKEHQTELAKPGQGHGVSYKYLLHPRNIRDVFNAANTAKQIGCRNMHIRPAGASWDKQGKNLDYFSYTDICEFEEQLTKARSLEDEVFGVFGITHKFDGNFKVSNEFNNCHAIFMTGVFMPPSSEYHAFNFGLCCDRRGDSNLAIQVSSPKQILDFWGSEKHWEIYDKIKVSDCPRCTYQPHNQIYEESIEKDNLTFDFI